MDGIKSRTVVEQVVVRGRAFNIERIAWTYTGGLSFDVYDVETGQCLTAESYDDWPSARTVEDLLEQLAEDLSQGSLDPYFEDCEQTLSRIVEGR